MLKIVRVLCLLCLLSTLNACLQPVKKQVATRHAYKTVRHTDPHGFHYETVTGDPTGLRLYTLANGMKVYMAKNNDESKIQTYVAVRAGSVYDPADNTGLAHYLEHMMFKGTKRIGTRNWKKEAPLLERLSDLFEKHKAETDPKKKLAIYKQIDRVSQQAARYCIPDEYSKLIRSLGSTAQNAQTWFESTVYQDKIPSNELDKWLQLQGERFRGVVLRLFHTELEAVYEEFNRIQDNDQNEAYLSMLDALFPTHPYGQQTAIGTATHLKNPSMVAIHKYFDRYYVPDNMALVLVGDLDFDRSIQAVNRYFGSYERREVHFPTRPREKPLSRVVTREVVGPSPAMVSIAFRTEGIKSDQIKYVRLVDMLLSNSSSGLIDLNLNQKQKVQHADSYTEFMNDYGFQALEGTPKAGQSLEAVKDLLLAQLDKIKQGDFQDWMIQAVVNDLKLQRMHREDDATKTATDFYKTFIHFQSWRDHLKALDDMAEVSKGALVKFANDFYKDNYVVVYKRHGKNPSLVKLKSPPITPIPLNRAAHSTYFSRFMARPEEPIKTDFVDYAEALHYNTLENGLPIIFVANEKNDLCSLNFVFDMGSDSDREFPLAVGYLDYLGTDRYSPQQLRQAFYRLGMNYHIEVKRHSLCIQLSGLGENLADGLGLLEDFIQHMKVDRAAYQRYIQEIEKKRADTRKDKDAILSKGLVSYVKYGEKSPLRNIYSMEALRHINPEELISLIRGLRYYKHRVFYYGKDRKQAIRALEAYYAYPEEPKDCPAARRYKKLQTGGKVYLVDYDMVQARLVFLAKDTPFDTRIMAEAAIFNSYFGSGMSSVFYQDIRESRALAYEAFSRYINAREKGDSNYMLAYIATQADKMPRAIDEVLRLLNEMPYSKKQFAQAKTAVLKRLASHRVTRENIFWNHEAMRRRGLDNEYKARFYKAVQKTDWNGVKAFFDKHIKGKKFDLIVMGNKRDLDLKALSKFGKVRELSVDQLFNFDKS